GDTEQSEAMRLNHMYQEMGRLALWSAPFNEVYVACMEGVKYTSDKVEAAIKSVMSNRVGATSVASNALNESIANLDGQMKILDPNVSQTKGRKKDVKAKDKVHASGRMKSSIDSLSVFALHPLYLRVQALSKKIPEEIKQQIMNEKERLNLKILEEKYCMDWDLDDDEFYFSIVQEPFSSASASTLPSNWRSSASCFLQYCFDFFRIVF
ncbi:hypothetical protein Dimus_011117, partial [Dionaea muscipula]